MSIKDLSKKIKDLAQKYAPRPGTLSDDLFLGLVIALVAIGAFGLGRLSKIEGSKAPIRIENEPATDGNTFSQQKAKTVVTAAPSLQEGRSGGTIVASKSGTKYYYSWCSGAQKIAAANLVTFSTKEQAQAAGYAPSTTCKGL